MNYSEIIGIDVSKLTLDIHVFPSGLSFESENNPTAIKKMLKRLEKECQVTLTSALFAFECTGFYSHKLALALQELGYHYVMLSGLELRRSLGITRGKSDGIDAINITEYVYLRRNRITPTQLPEADMLRMKRLLSLRDRLVRQRTGFKCTLSEVKRAISRKEDPLYYQVQERMVKELTLEIQRIEKELLDIIKSNPELQEQYDLITSIKGVGKITTLTMIAFTHGFRRFATWRKFACYSGIAPFPYQSGTSIKGRTKISHLANKRMKSLLGNITGTAIQHNTEMKIYYQKRLEQGKHKMSTQNAIRNKLLARIFAVVQRGTPYVDTLKYAA